MVEFSPNESKKRTPIYFAEEVRPSSWLRIATGILVVWNALATVAMYLPLAPAVGLTWIAVNQVDIAILTFNRRRRFVLLRTDEWPDI
jgi:hypothetical protein